MQIKILVKKQNIECVESSSFIMDLRLLIGYMWNVE
jgi:hypothetical protein